MRLTSFKKRSAIVVIPFHDFAFDVAIFLASYIIDERVDFIGFPGVVRLRFDTGPVAQSRDRRELEVDTVLGPLP
jgi:hypothetical protein